MKSVTGVNFYYHMEVNLIDGRTMCNNQITFWDNPKVKPRVVFTEDNTGLHKDFKKDSEFELFMEQSENYIIYHADVF